MLDSSFRARFPYLDEEKLSKQFVRKLEAENVTMCRRFLSCVHQIASSLKEKDINLDKVKLLVLKQFRIPEISDCENVTAVITTILIKSCTFLNYKIMETLINDLGDEDSKVIMDTYKLEFREFYKRRLCEVPIDSLKSDREVENKLCVKTDKKFDIPLEYVNSLQQRLTELLITPLLLVGVEDGCVLFEFDCLDQLSLQITDQNSIDEFVKLGITKIYTDENILYQAFNDEAGVSQIIQEKSYQIPSKKHLCKINLIIEIVLAYY